MVVLEHVRRAGRVFVEPGGEDPLGLVSRTRCGILHAAPQSRDRTKHRALLRPRLCSAPRREVRRAALRPGNATRYNYFLTQITRTTDALASAEPPLAAVTPLAFKNSR